MKWTARTVAAAVGGCSLILEVMWIRVGGFASAGEPAMFGIVLSLYLIGIAAGAWWGRGLCSGTVGLVRTRGAVVLFVSSVFDLLTPAMFVWLLHRFPVLVAMMPLVLIGALLKSLLFPVVHHLGSNDSVELKGISFSLVYFFNVLGCTLGPLVVTLWALDRMPSEWLFVLVAAVSALAGVGLLPSLRGRLSAVAIGVGFVFFALPRVPPLIENLILVTGGVAPKSILERKEGIIHVVEDSSGDIVFGGNAYDGRINVDLHSNVNKIDRVYAVMAAAPAVRTVLVVGLSGGSWTRVISSFGDVERIDVVEIHPGYLDLIASYPEVSPILSDSKINIHIGDGRQWLRQSSVDYDVIVVNSTFHWRSGATNLLSREFFGLLQSRLARGGVALVNTTGSPEVLRTAGDVFDHAYLYGNSVIVSDLDYRSRLAAGGGRIFSTKMDNVRVFDVADVSDKQVVEKVLKMKLKGLEELELEVGRKAEVNSDLKMLTEFRYGRELR